MKNLIWTKKPFLNQKNLVWTIKNLVWTKKNLVQAKKKLFFFCFFFKKTLVFSNPAYVHTL